MTRLGLPVPPGFTISTEICTYFYDHQKTYPEGLSDQVEGAHAQMEKSVGKRLGDRTNPLLLSVRSGARLNAGHEKNAAEMARVEKAMTEIFERADSSGAVFKTPPMKLIQP